MRILLMLLALGVAGISNAVIGKSYPITVNYYQSIEKMIEAGKYDRKNSLINSEHFPIDREGLSRVEIKLIQFSRTLTSLEVFYEVYEKMGFRYANLPELLAFGAKYSDVQREFDILALGYVWKNWRGYGDTYGDVAYLGIFEGKRELSLYWFGDKWGTDVRFAVVCRQTKK